ncbi:putative hydrolase or acyltransferase of alpha/beta superfamily [Desulfosporosinus acidiphilus SJ4]|uniref:Putative hydrolase or acyltransferase of alpha/beta superfamily n=1 Tax=Desulfosporosinus acidiphilus (strain DSM 22704 / JCM 16185 / SJ4) TaxID=646529 RepID=I4D137_DESAJ|nr:alpha/beta fold hydrolase [Desulfosporosinus acidiphilus]AFM39511.1 putative hydrolase or acyltransferase of alpha/beta superfamily [Desulfosporosinus acidiphilus SJ4]
MAFVLNNSVKINYEVEGDSNRDCLVLQHGFFGSISDWYDYGYVDALKTKYKLILIDARGHGKSDKPHCSEEYSLYLRSQDIIRILDAQKIDQCHYFGYSMGGWISFGLMKWFKSRFQSFILDAIHPCENDMLSLRNSVLTLEDWVPKHDVSAEHKKRFLSNDKEALLAAIEETRTDNTELLKNISVPCLMLAGENDAIHEKVRESAKLSSNIEFISIPHSDHWFSLYNSDFIIPQIERFIANITGAQSPA